jgi:hypothetical protein
VSADETILGPARGIVREAFEDEVIIINLDSGTYYSLNGTGVAVWTILEGGASLHEVVATMAAGYDAETTTIESDVRALVERLLAEQLLCQEHARPSGPTIVPAEGEKRPYAPPQLSTFTDMQELLRLDPVHDVDEAGWPHRPKPGSEE